jgi:hypothetical protein
MRTKCFADRFGIVPHFAFQQSHADKCVNSCYVQHDHKAAPALPSAFPVQAHAFGSSGACGYGRRHYFSILDHPSTSGDRPCACDHEVMALYVVRTFRILVGRFLESIWLIGFEGSSHSAGVSGEMVRDLMVASRQRRILA